MWHHIKKLPEGVSDVQEWQLLRCHIMWLALHLFKSLIASISNSSSSFTKSKLKSITGPLGQIEGWKIFVQFLLPAAQPIPTISVKDVDEDYCWILFSFWKDVVLQRQTIDLEMCLFYIFDPDFFRSSASSPFGRYCPPSYNIILSLFL